MIRLVLAQLAARWGQALTLLVLSAAVTAAAVGAPAYADTVDREVLASERAAADPADLSVSFPVMPGEVMGLDGGPVNSARRVLGELPEFTPVFTRGIRVRGLREGASPTELHRLVGRDGFCDRVVFRQGRCPVGGREVALPADLAEAVARGVGDEVVVTPTAIGPQGTAIPHGPPVPVAVVGVFEAVDPTDPYWTAGVFPLGGGGLDPAMFTTLTGMAPLQYSLSEETVRFQAVLPEAALTADRVPAIRDQLAAAQQRMDDETGAGPGLVGGTLTTNLPRLLDRIASQGDQARNLLPVTAAPLVALGWLVVYLAVGHGVSARRQELAVVALRGAKRRTRAVMVAAESLVPVLVGVPVGMLAAALLVALAGRGAAAPDLAALADDPLLAAAGLAAAGTVVAVLVAQWRELAAPVVQLLRRVPPRQRAVVAAGELLAVGLALVVLADLRLFDRDLAGATVVAPAVVMLVAAMLVARALRPLVDLVGRRSLRRGWLGTSLAALYLARRPGAARLVVVLGLALGMLGFAVTSTQAAAQGRATDAAQVLGADRVLSVQQADRYELLAAVRAADPQGQYAMAVVETPDRPDEPPVLAVDTTRLAEVALWSDRYGDTGPARVAELLRPSAGPDPIRVGDGELVAEVGLDFVPEGATVTGLVSLQPDDGGDRVVVELGPLAGSQQQHRAEVTGCADGCRLAGLGFVTDTTLDPSEPFYVIWQELRQDGAQVLGREWLGDLSRWRIPDEFAPVDITGADGGLGHTHLHPIGDQPSFLFPLDTPHPLPVVSADTSVPAGLLTGVDGAPVEVIESASLAGLPGLPDGGVLMDLEYAERNTTAPGSARVPQVWLAADAPTEIVDRLQDEGLVIAEQQDLETAQATLDRGGAALALRFFLVAAGVAGGVGLLALALVVAVDRGAWVRSLRELRVQGLAGRVTRRAVRWSYGAVVLVAAVAGALAVAAAWLATRDRVPLGVEPAVLPPWPQWEPVLVPWAVAVAVLLAAAVVTAAWLRWSLPAGPAGEED